VDSSGDEDLRDLMQRLDALVAGARSMPLVQGQLILEREPVYYVLDGMRLSLPFAIRDVRWFRQRRANDGDPPLRGGEVESLDLLAEIDAVDDLVHTARMVPLTDSVRVRRDRLAPILDRMRAALVPLGQELADFRSIYRTARSND
jgi:hypothetical protein